MINGVFRRSRRELSVVGIHVSLSRLTPTAFTRAGGRDGG